MVYTDEEAISTMVDILSQIAQLRMEIHKLTERLSEHEATSSVTFALLDASISEIALKAKPTHCCDKS